MKFFFKTLLTCLFLFCYMQVSARRSNEEPFPMTQPDGTTLTVRLHGDEFFRYYTTEDNYVIILNDASVFVYADYDAQFHLIAGKVKAHNISERGTEERMYLSERTTGLPPKVELASQVQVLSARSIQETTSSSMPSIGKQRAIVILVNFKDLKFTINKPREEFSNYLNQVGYTNTFGAKGSVHDYFYDNSSGKFDITFDVFGPVNLNNTMSYYGSNSPYDDANAKYMVRDACYLLNTEGNVDFSIYDRDKDGSVDNVYIVFPGYDEAAGASPNTVWSHRMVNPGITLPNNMPLAAYACCSELKSYKGNKMNGIGTFCHEFGHVIGLPDFYVTGSSTSIMERYFLMDSGNTNDNSNTPPYLSAIERSLCGWIEPKILSSDPATITIPSIKNNVAYQINTVNENEYFLLEARTPIGWDNTDNVSYHGYGLLIYHIDRSADYINRWSISGTSSSNSLNKLSYHRCCYPKKANNTMWTFPQNGKNAFTDETSPNSLSWSDENTEVPITNITYMDNQITIDVNGGNVNAPIENMNAISYSVEGDEITVFSLPTNSSLTLYSLSGIPLKQYHSENMNLTIPFPYGLRECIMQIQSGNNSVSYKLIK